MIVNLCRLKREGYKLLFLLHRPLSMEVCGIGAWDHMFDDVLKIAVVVSMGIMTKTSLALQDWGLSDETCTRIWFFTCLFFFAFIKVSKLAVPPISPAVELQLSRQQLYSSRVLFGLSVGEAFDEAESESCVESENLLRARHQTSTFR